MNICMLGGMAFPPRTGGIDVHIYEITQELVQLDNRVYIITARYSNQQPIEYFFNRKVIVIRIPFVNIKYLRKISFIIPLLLLIIRINPDIIHIHDPITCFFCNLLLRNKRNKIILTLHGLDFINYIHSRFIMILFKKIVIYSINNIKEVFTVDQSIIYQYNINNKIKFIPNGARYVKWPFHASRNVDLFLFVGRLIWIKGIDNLISSFNRIPHHQLWIIGDGNRRVNILKSLPDNISYLGRIEHSDIYNYFQQANYLILPSYSEGFPITVLEAMINGTICITTKVGEVSNHFEHLKNIYFLENNSSEAINTAISYLTKNPEICENIRKNAFNKVKTCFNWKIVALIYDKRYEEVTF